MKTVKATDPAVKAALAAKLEGRRHADAEGISRGRKPKSTPSAELATLLVTAALAPTVKPVRVRKPKAAAAAVVTTTPKADEKAAKVAAKAAAWANTKAKMEEALEEHDPETPCEHCEDPTVQCQAEQVRILYALKYSIGSIAKLLGVPYHQAYNPIFRLSHPYEGKKAKAAKAAAALVAAGLKAGQAK